LASSETDNFNYIPKDYNIPSDADYFHCTSNNTIYGSQMQAFPESPVPMVCDMSSDIFSREVDATKFGLIYAGAQKNMGAAGVTLAVVKKSLFEQSKRTIPSMLNYRLHAENDSMYNTPPVFALFVSMLTMRWIKEMGGPAAMGVRNEAKAKLIYDELDSNPLFEGTVVKEDRSRMNVNFVMTDKALEGDFLKYVEAEGFYGLKGHRSVGGFRASLYNALEIESVSALVEAMRAFALKTA
jgi:phosphoserine aminotransferase